MGPFDSLNIYYQYGLPKSGFIYTIGNRPLLSVKFFLCDTIFGDTIFGDTIFFLVGLSFTVISFVYCFFGGP